MSANTKGEHILGMALKAGSYTAANISMKRAAEILEKRRFLVRDKRNEKVFFITEKGLDWLGNGA